MTVPWRGASLPTSVEELTFHTLSDMVVLSALLPRAVMARYLWKMGEEVLGWLHVKVLSLPQLLLREQMHMRPLTLFLTDQENLVSQVNLSHLEELLSQTLQVSWESMSKYIWCSGGSGTSFTVWCWSCSRV